MINNQVIARIKLKSTNDGFLNGGIASGYNPHHKFEHWDFLLSGMHEYADSNRHYPGEEIVAEIRFASWEDMKSQIQVGDEFSVQELNTVVGTGVVEEIVS